jgi:iron(II)-dependent oxidoreductase
MTAWCEISGGSFARGTPDSPDERPVVEVTLSSYQMSKYPVTNREFTAFIEAGGYHTEELWTKVGWQQRLRQGWSEPNYWRSPPWNAPDVPVSGVSWWEALAFARWARAALPTEAQWEHAARGSDERPYPWGHELPDLSLANFAPDCQPVERVPTSVNAHPRNRSPFGCEDMAGNFGEWCLDNARVGYVGDPCLIDPVYVTREEDDHIVRGGSGLHDAGALRCTSRDYYSPLLRDNMICVRLARSRGEHAG